MPELRIKILGNGGCLNSGLSHNAFVLNGHVLVEAPPDVVVSMQRHGVDAAAIDTVYVSHLHGDHTFGLPFVIINKWLAACQGRDGGGLTVLGPAGIEKMIRQLVLLAFGPEHPCVPWMDKRVRHQVIGQDFACDFDGMELGCFVLDHPLETYGFHLGSGGDTAFAYVADTRWCPSVEKTLARGARLVLMDMNGGEGNIHISPEEAQAKALPLMPEGARLYGTHLDREFDSIDGVLCARPGDVITLAG